MTVPQVDIDWGPVAASQTGKQQVLIYEVDCPHHACRPAKLRLSLVQDYETGEPPRLTVEHIEKQGFGRT